MKLMSFSTLLSCFSFSVSCQMLLADLRELRGVLDNLIWKGSELSASMRLKDLDIKDTLKQLEEKWKEAVKRAEKKLSDLEDLRIDWAERENMLANMESWVILAEDQLVNEQGLSSRDEDSLKEALAYYEVWQSVSVLQSQEQNQKFEWFYTRCVRKQSLFFTFILFLHCSR